MLLCVGCFLSTTRPRLCSSSGCLLCLLSLCVVDNSEGNIVEALFLPHHIIVWWAFTFLTEAPRVSLRLQPNPWLRPIGFLSSQIWWRTREGWRACERERQQLKPFWPSFDLWEQSCFLVAYGCLLAVKIPGNDVMGSTFPHILNSASLTVPFT